MPIDWKQILEMVTPVAGQLAAGGHGADLAFQQAFQHGQLLAKQEQQQKADRALKLQEAGGRYSLEAFSKLNALEDPTQFDQLHQLLVQHAPDAGTRADLGRLTFDTKKIEQGKLKELNEQIAKFDPTVLEQMTQSGASFKMKDGSYFPVSTALSVTGRRLFDPSGNPLPMPKKADTNPPTDYGRFLAKYAKDKGKSVDALTAIEELAAKHQYDMAGNNQARPAAGVEGQFEDGIAQWKETHPGQGPSPAVRMQLRVQAQKQIGQAADKPATVISIPGLSDMTPAERVETAAQALISNRMAPSQLATFFVGMGKDSASQLRSLVMQRVSQLQPDFNFSQAEANYKFGSSAATQSTVRYIDNIKKTLPVLRQASADFKRSNVRVINQALLAGKSQVGNTDVVKFEFARNILADEIAKILQGGGTGSGTSDAKLQQAQQLLSGDMTVAQFDTALNMADELIGMRGTSLTKGTFMERPSDTTPSVEEWVRDPSGKLVKKKGTP